MQVLKVFVEAKQLRELHHQNNIAADEYPFSVDDYVADIREYTGYEINLNQLNRPQRQAKGRLHRYDEKKRADIYVAPIKTTADDEHGISACEQRYIILKECAHLVIDTADSYTTSIEHLADELILSNIVGKTLTDLREEVQSEWLAEILALELLFPSEVRAACKNGIENGDRSFYEVANQFKIPERMVRWVLHKDVYNAINILRDAVSEVAEAVRNRP